MFRGITRHEFYVLIGVCFVAVAGMITFAVLDQRKTVAQIPAKPAPPITFQDVEDSTGEESTSDNPESETEQSLESSPAFTNGILDINKATQIDLETLPGIGPKKAEAILAYRDQYGLFPTVESITNVSGIGEKTLENLRPLITVGNVIPSIQTNLNESGQANDRFQQLNQANNVNPENQIIRVNTATFEQLQELNGIGPALAKKILIDRQLNGPYRSSMDLQRVKGIGPKTVENMGNQLSFE